MNTRLILLSLPLALTLTLSGCTTVVHKDEPVTTTTTTEETTVRPLRGASTTQTTTIR